MAMSQEKDESGPLCQFADIPRYYIDAQKKMEK